MIDREVWLDKLPCDKAKYYNKSRMSLELFCRKLDIREQDVLEELGRNGYAYNYLKRMFEPSNHVPPMQYMRDLSPLYRAL